MYLPGRPTAIDQSVVVETLYFHALDDHLAAVVLTPACDFEQRKAELAIACAAISAWDLIAQLAQTDWVKEGLVDESGSLKKRGDLSNSKIKWFKAQISRMIKQQYPRYHWLAPIPHTNLPPLVADFQIIACLPIDVIVRATPIASLQSPFREQLPARYAAYMGRVGTPDLEVPILETWLEQAVDSVFSSDDV
jgi:hypothetical protein